MTEMFQGKGEVKWEKNQASQLKTREHLINGH